MKKKVISLLILLFLFPCRTEIESISPYRFYSRMVKKQKVGTIRIYDSPDLTAEILETRGDSVIIEKCIGRCLNNKGDGEIMGVNGPYNYISYRSVNRVRKNDIILTLFIYNPIPKGEEGNVDDIEMRIDYIIDRK